MHTGFDPSPVTGITGDVSVDGPIAIDSSLESSGAGVVSDAYVAVGSVADVIGGAAIAVGSMFVDGPSSLLLDDFSFEAGEAESIKSLLGIDTSLSPEV